MGKTDRCYQIDPTTPILSLQRSYAIVYQILLIRQRNKVSPGCSLNINPYYINRYNEINPAAYVPLLLPQSSICRRGQKANPFFRQI